MFTARKSGKIGKPCCTTKYIGKGRLGRDYVSELYLPFRLLLVDEQVPEIDILIE